MPVDSRFLRSADTCYGSDAAPRAPAVLCNLLKGTDVKFNGPRPWDILVHDAETYHRILDKGSLGFGEAYMDGLWDSVQLDELFAHLLGADLDERLHKVPRARLLGAWLVSVARNRLLNRQGRGNVRRMARRHYDIGNDVFEAMLDPTMSYSCGYWRNADTLAQAQRDKLDLICRKLALSPGERLLDIGCGFGALAHYAAAHYGVEVHGVTVSKAQRDWALDYCRGLPVTISLQDYRDVDGSFDKAVSVGMFEHVGAKNYATFFDVVDRALKPDGLLLLHTIGNYLTTDITDAWIEKYIFPYGQLPSAQRIAAALEPAWVIRDWEEFGPDYDRTLMAWWSRFDRAWPGLERRYGETFYRMWKYYLLSCAGMFRCGQARLWQIVVSRRGEQADYRSVR